jgi:hypothetical protein
MFYIKVRSKCFTKKILGFAFSFFELLSRNVWQWLMYHFEICNGLYGFSYEYVWKPSFSNFAIKEMVWDYNSIVISLKNKGTWITIE